jgi:hypothetical protein
VVSTFAVDQTARAAARALGWIGDAALPYPDEAVLYASAGTVWGLIEGATRGRGCPVDLLPTSDPPTAEELAAIEAAATAPADLGAVALAATLRLAPNPAQRVSESTTTEGVGSRRVEGSFAGFTLAETLVLNRYRRRVR